VCTDSTNTTAITAITPLVLLLLQQGPAALRKLVHEP